MGFEIIKEPEKASPWEVHVMRLYGKERVSEPFLTQIRALFREEPVSCTWDAAQTARSESCELDRMLGEKRYEVC